MYTYLWCFFIYAFLGWCAEVVYAAFLEKRFVNRGFLSGPLCPIYGFGVVLIDFCLRPFHHNIPALLIGSMLVGSGLEWFAGFLLEKVFHQKWWDYSNEPHNLNGYICLRFSILWAFAGTAVVGLVMPFSRYLVSFVPRMAGWIILAVLLSLAFADFTVTVVAIIGLNRKLKHLERITERLRSGSDKLGEELYAGASLLEERLAEQNWQEEVQQLKAKYEEILHANPLHRRLLKAFPDLQSLRHNEQLEALRQNINIIRRRSTEALRRRDEAAVAAYEETLPENAEKPFAFGLCCGKLFWIFMIGNVVGFALETIYAIIVPPHLLEWRVSVVFGPFIMVYGFGAVALTLILRKMYNQKDFLIFLASMVIGGAFEYLCSFFQQAAFGMVSWEYSDSMLNISGRTNLLYSFFWGILGLVWVKDLYPFLSRLIQKIPKRVGKPLTVAVSLFMAADMAISAAAIYRQSERINNIPADNGVRVFLDTYFPDEFMKTIYPHMEYVGKPEIMQHEPPLPPNQD